MSNHPPRAADTGLFRRRIPLELTSDEIAVLEAAQPRYGTKRATLVAGLEALASLDDVQARLAEAEAARDTALAEAAAMGERAEKAERGSASTAAKAKAGRQATAKATQKLEADLAGARAQLEQVMVELADEQDARQAWEDAYARLQEEALSLLRCHRCQRWAPSEEWATRPAKDGGQIIYHQPCGFHQDGVVNPGTIMAFRHA